MYLLINCVLLILFLSLVDASLVTLTVDDGAPDAIDAGGSQCVGGGNTLVPCSLRSAFSYCSMFSQWAQLGQSAAANSCSIEVPESSTINLNASYGELLVEQDVVLYNFSISLWASGSGATIKRTGSSDVYALAISMDASSVSDETAVGIATISNLSFEKFSNSDIGGALYFYSMENVKLTNVNITKCSSTGGAGAFIDLVSYVTISSCVFGNNAATSDGGALYINDVVGYVIVSDSIFEENVADSGSEGVAGGGAIFFDSSVDNVTISNSLFTLNRAGSGAGIGFYSNNDGITISNSVFLSNTATVSGGGLRLEISNIDVVLTDVTFDSNTADLGGGFYSMMLNYPIDMKNVYFNENSATTSGGGLYFVEQDNFTATDLLIDGNRAEGSDGGGMFVDGSSSNLFISSSTITNNYASAHGAGAAFGLTLTTIEFSGVNFTNNYGSFQGGALYFFSSATDVSISNTTISSNTAEFGGGIFIDQFFTNLDLVDTDFLDNQASVSGGALYIGLHNTDINVSSCNFYRNSAVGLEGGAVMVGSQNTIMEILNSTFYGNSANRGAGGAVQVEFENTALKIYGSVFTNNTASMGGAISASTDNIISLISACSFSYNTASVSGGAVILSSQNAAVFDSCAFEFNSMDHETSLSGGGALFIYEYNQVTIQNSSISENSVNADGQGGGGMLISSNNDITIKGSTFSDNYVETAGGAIHSESYNSIDIQNSNFSNNFAGITGGAIAIDSLHTSPVVSGNIFSYNVADNGGAMVIGDELTTAVAGSETIDATVYSNAFISNSAIYGGALVIGRVLTADIVDCSFSGNFVLTDGASINTDSTTISNDYSGGAIALLNSCSDITIQNCTVYNNSAQYGSFLYANEAKRILVSDSSLTNNDAEAYGTIYWVYYSTALNSQIPVMENLKESGNAQGYGTNIFATQGISLLAAGTDSAIGDGITILASEYGVNPPITVYVVDYYDNIKYTDEARAISGSVQSGYEGCYDRGTGSVSGQTIMRTVDGFVNFTELAVSCFPAGNMTLVFTATSVTVTTLFVDFEQCADGYYLSNYQCTECPIGEYSLEYIGDTTTCLTAPSHTDASLTYGNNLYVSPGYWRVNNYTTTLTACPYGSLACLGEYRSGTNSCVTGYEGVLCGVCSSGYYANTFSTTPACTQCSSGSSILFVILAPLCMVLILGGVIVVGNLGTKRFEVLINTIAFGGAEASFKSFNSGGNLGSFYAGEESAGARLFDVLIGKVKILISVYQIVADFPTILNINFPSALMNLFRAFSFINIIGFQMPSAECYSTGRIDYVDTLLMTTLLPIMVSGVIFLGGCFELAYFDYHFKGNEIEARKQHRKLFSRYITLFLLLTYMVLPSVSSYIAAAYACTDSDPDNVDPGTDFYLTADLSIACNSSRYKFGVIWASLMLFVYPIGIPVLYFYLLYTNRNDIINRHNATYVTRHPHDSKFSTSALSFLYTQYEPQYWYWEVIETLRRLFFTSLLAFGISTSTYQIVGSLLMAVLFMKLYAYFRPYRENDDDVLQEVAQYQVFFTLLGALLIDTNAFGGNKGTSVAIAVSLVIVNISSTGIAFYYVTVDWMEKIEAQRMANDLDGIGESVEEGNIKDSPHNSPPSPMKVFKFFAKEAKHKKKVHPLTQPVVDQEASVASFDPLPETPVNGIDAPMPPVTMDDAPAVPFENTRQSREPVSPPEIELTASARRMNDIMASDGGMNGIVVSSNISVNLDMREEMTDN